MHDDKMDRIWNRAVVSLHWLGDNEDYYKNSSQYSKCVSTGIRTKHLPNRVYSIAVGPIRLTFSFLKIQFMNEIDQLSGTTVQDRLTKCKNLIVKNITPFFSNYIFMSFIQTPPYF
jgi:hypothetical protein